MMLYGCNNLTGSVIKKDTDFIASLRAHCELRVMDYRIVIVEKLIDGGTDAVS